MRKLIVASEALASGELTRRDLRRSYHKVHRNVYRPRDIELTAADKAVAAWLWSGRTATVAGMSAAALLGSAWVPADRPAELVRTQHAAPPDIVVHQDHVVDDEIRTVGDVACTTVPRTVFDLGRWLPFEEALIRIDALLNGTGLTAADIRNLATDHPGARNIRQLRQLLAIADGGAESPQETRTRLVLIRGQLPTPTTQIPILDKYGRVVRRIDMGWPEWKVGVEYDGEQHWTNARIHAGDIGRLEFLASQGWTIIRVSAWHLRNDKPGIVLRAATALQKAGLDLSRRELGC